MHAQSANGFLWVIAAGSGTGKSTICQKLLHQLPGAMLSISYTTRPPRQNEKDGVHYHFVSKDAFKRMIEKQQFLEWAKVHDHFYGTGKAMTEDLLGKGHDVLLDIDVQGAKSIKEIFGERSILIFILPPSVEEMIARLKGRRTDNEVQIARRLRTARSEIPKAIEFDYLVINDQIEACVHRILAIRDAVASQPNQMKSFLSSLMKQLP